MLQGGTVFEYEKNIVIRRKETGYMEEIIFIIYKKTVRFYKIGILIQQVWGELEILISNGLPGNADVAVLQTEL